MYHVSTVQEVTNKKLLEEIISHETIDTPHFSFNNIKDLIGRLSFSSALET
jgi:hypothetical protein